jgi:predicted nucleic acid-binding protein
MTRYILLDSGPLGMVTHPRASGTTLSCQLWLNAQLQKGTIVIIPEISDYEVRRELIRAGKMSGIRQLDQLKSALEYAPITTEVMLRAAELWAKARQLGQPTADPSALDGDVILAAQSIVVALEKQQSVIVATTNVGHLARFTIAQHWQEMD